MFDLTRRRLLTSVAGSLAVGTLAVPAHAKAWNARVPRVVPLNYRIAANGHGIPPAILFGVALQESSRLWKTPQERTLLPWPWTLNIAGEPFRAQTESACLARILYELGRGQTRMDIGLMQVHWRYHAHRFSSPAHAINPFINLDAGAAILAEHFKSTGKWHLAVARYHNADPAIGAAYAASVFRFVMEVASV
jgi:hypothetical protein